MDTSKWLLLVLAALAAAPILFAIAAVIASWRSIKHRALFSAITLLTFYGLGSLVFSMVQGIYQAVNASDTMYLSPMFRVLSITAVLVAVLGFPIVWRLRRALRAPN